jgi:hypothetical protein
LNTVKHISICLLDTATYAEVRKIANAPLPAKN